MSRAKAVVIIHRSDAVSAAASLRGFDGLEIIESREDTDPRWQELAEAYADRRERIEELAGILGIERGEAPSVPREASPEKDEETIDRAVADIGGVTEQWQNRKRKTEQLLEHLSLLLEGMRRLEPVDIPVGEFLSVHYLHLDIGTIPREHWERLEVLLFRTPAAFIPLFESENDLVTVAATDREHAVFLDRVLRSVFFKPFQWPEDLTGAPAEAAERLEERLREARVEQDGLESRRRELAGRWKERLLELQERVHEDLDIARFLSRCAVHGDYYLITATIPARKSRQLAEIVETAANGPHALFTTSPAGAGG